MKRNTFLFFVCIMFVSCLIACGEGSMTQTNEVPVSTTAPETTAVPVTTKAHETTAAPVTTKAPETTAAPVTTKAPVITATPVTTAAPAITTAASVVTEPATNIVIHSISELNTTEYELDSAVGDESQSTLVQDLRASYTLTPQQLGGIKAYYPRIKKINDSEYILIFHNGTYGGSVFCSRSSDCINWSRPVPVFRQRVISVNGKQDNLKYMTPDACVLSDGRILCVTAYRVEHTYYNGLAENGISISFSEDNGKTWSAPQKVYTGLNWEPSALEAKNGEIYIYFTAIATTIHQYGYGNHSSGVGLLRSTDGGKTWTPNVTEAPYLPQYVMRQYVYTNDKGIDIYSDQMPVAIELHNGTIALAVETHDDKNYTFSISYNNDGYKEDLGLDTSGPVDRQTQLFSLAGPYLAQFDSGEVVLTYHWAGTMRYRLGTADARSFFKENIILKDVGQWGSVESISSHSAVMLMGTPEYSLKVARMYLNHTINAMQITPSLTGNTQEWDDNTDAIFVSGTSQAQTAVRIAHDSEYIYILGERLDNYITGKDQLWFYVHDGNGGQYSIVASNTGITAKHQESGKSATKMLDAEKEGIEFRITTSGTENDETDTDQGVVYEFAIPKKLLTIQDGAMFFRAIMVNVDKTGGRANMDDSNPSAKLTSTAEWAKAVLK